MIDEKMIKEAIIFFLNSIQPDIWSGKNPGYGFTHLAELYSIPCFVHTETKEIKGATWLDDKLIKSIKLANQITGGESLPVVIKSKL